MIRVALLSALLLAGGSFLNAQKKGDSPLLKVGLEDPFTEKDPKAMEKLGIVSYGPLVWADNKRTTDIEKVLGEGRVLWMETEHFKIGCNLGFSGAPKDSVARRQLKDEMKRLNKKCSKIPASKSKMDPWLRMHLYALRAEEMYAEFVELTGKNEPGKHLGQKEKFLLLLFQKKSDLARYMTTFGNRKSEQSQRLRHYGTGHFSVVMTAEGDDGPRDSETTNAQFRFFMAQMFCDAAGGGPTWLTYGLGHYYERQIPCNMINCGIKANESVDSTTQYQWEKKMLKRTKHDGLCLPFPKLATESDLGYHGHVQAWSVVDYMMQDRTKFTQFLQLVLGKPSSSHQLQALESVFEMDSDAFDAAWVKWAQKTYK
jgi:hypothetical protein